MQGSNHVTANVATVAIGYFGTVALGAALGGDKLSVLGNYLSHDWLTDFGLPSAPLLIFALDAIAFLLASLLPDIDSPSSALGRHIPFPGNHRGITHSIWPCILFLVAGVTCRLFMWVFLGYTLHLVWDSFSTAGICWFYPISNYKRYSSGAFVKKGYHLRLYRVGSVSEGVVIGVLIAVAILLFGLEFFGLLPVQEPWTLSELKMALASI